MSFNGQIPETCQNPTQLTHMLSSQETATRTITKTSPTILNSPSAATTSGGKLLNYIPELPSSIFNVDLDCPHLTGEVYTTDSSGQTFQIFHWGRYNLTCSIHSSGLHRSVRQCQLLHITKWLHWQYIKLYTHRIPRDHGRIQHSVELLDQNKWSTNSTADSG